MKLRTFLRRRKKVSAVRAEEALTLTSPGQSKARQPLFVLRRVVGDSMYPTLQPGELVIARKRHTIAPGDVVVFRHKGLEKIKRIREADGTRLYVVGDNPNFSTDSRHYGMIFIDDVLGTVIWPRLDHDT